VRHRMRFVLAVMVGCLLFTPSVAGATILSQTYLDPQDLDPALHLQGMDIQYFSHTYDTDTGFHTFSLDMYGALGGADYYGVYIKNGPVDTSEEFWYAFYAYRARVDENWVLQYSGMTDVSYAADGEVLEWKMKIPQLNLDGFSWWAVTQKGDGINVSDYAIAPIPNSVWLLGSGLVGLIGLSRRIRR